MFHIEPISYPNADEKLKEVYQDIMEVFETQNVPLFFQLMANFEEYLFYIWPQIKKNVQDPYFQKMAQSVESLIDHSINEVYHPEQEVIAHLQKNIPLEMKENYLSDLKKVITLNSQLALIFISLREAVKGWAVGFKTLEANNNFREPFDINFSQSKFTENKNIQSVETTIIDDFEIVHTGNNLTISFYPKLLALMLSEMDDLIKQKEYLFKRVQLEEYVLSQLLELPHPIDSSYAKVSRFAYKYAHFDELIYILYETFPTSVVSRLSTSVLGKDLLEKLQTTNIKSQ